MSADGADHGAPRGSTVGRPSAREADYEAEARRLDALRQKAPTTWALLGEAHAASAAIDDWRRRFELEGLIFALGLFARDGVEVTPEQAAKVRAAIEGRS